MSFDLTLRLIEAVGATAAGSTVRVSVDGPADVEIAKHWAEATGNTLLTVHPDAIDVFRGRVVPDTGCGCTATSTATCSVTTAASSRHRPLDDA
jgi:hypothetical protein